jgi:acyl-CoA reductase-like NAD-dependent aldehyde dehydrogenase
MNRLQSVNPSTGEVLGEVEVATVACVRHAVERARAAQPSWAAVPMQERVALLEKAAVRLAENTEALALLLTREMGKPLSEARGEVRVVAGMLASDPAAVAAALASESFENARTRTTVYRDPFGVVACISPWNFPVMMPHQQVVPALVAGNTVVAKPSEETPLVGQAYLDCLLEVLPEGVLQVVHGAEEQGKALVSSDVNLIVFTGSREAGKHILAEASKGLKRVILELGGKDPLIVLDDADIEAAARFSASSAFRNAGQVCVSTERIYVEPAVHDRFIAALALEAERMTVGDGFLEGTRIGPMIHERQRAHVLRQIEAAVADGATVAWDGGGASGHSFLAPIILADCTHDMGIAREETFGPVACIYRVDDEDDAVRHANDTRFGLGASVFGSPARAHRVARRLTAGMIGVNQGLNSAGSTPWVGSSESGYGFHSGPEGHRQFAQVRVVSERLMGT